MADAALQAVQSASAHPLGRAACHSSLVSRPSGAVRLDARFACSRFRRGEGRAASRGGRCSGQKSRSRSRPRGCCGDPSVTPLPVELLGGDGETIRADRRAGRLEIACSDEAPPWRCSPPRCERRRYRAKTGTDGDVDGERLLAPMSHAVPRFNVDRTIRRGSRIRRSLRSSRAHASLGGTPASRERSASVAARKLLHRSVCRRRPRVLIGRSRRQARVSRPRPRTTPALSSFARSSASASPRRGGVSAAQASRLSGPRRLGTHPRLEPCAPHSPCASATAAGSVAYTTIGIGPDTSSSSRSGVHIEPRSRRSVRAVLQRLSQRLRVFMLDRRGRAVGAALRSD